MKEKHSLDAHDFGRLSKTESNPRARSRLLILYQYSMGRNAVQIGESLSINAQTARNTKNRYLEEGLSSIYDKPRSGRHSKLAKDDEARFKQRIVESQESRKGGRLIARDIQRLASDEFNAQYTENGIYELLKRLDMSWISARSKHPKGDESVQQAYKKTSSTS